MFSLQHTKWLFSHLFDYHTFLIIISNKSFFYFHKRCAWNTENFRIWFIHECQLLSSDIFSLSIWLYMFCIVAICFCLYNYHRRKKKRYLQYNKLFSPPTANWNVLFVSFVISLFLYFFFYLARPTRFYSSWYIRCIIVGCKKTTILLFFSDCFLLPIA
jgi:hypothetical protein